MNDNDNNQNQAAREAVVIDPAEAIIDNYDEPSLEQQQVDAEHTRRLLALHEKYVEGPVLSGDEMKEMLGLLLRRDAAQMAHIDQLDLAILRYSGELYTKNSRIGTLEHQAQIKDNEIDDLKHHADNLKRIARRANEANNELTEQNRDLVSMNQWALITAVISTAAFLVVTLLWSYS